MKIYEIEGNGICGQTDIQRKVILINKNLRKYPKLRAFILRHEKQHLEENSYWKALLLDFKDYPVLYADPKFWEFHYKYVDIKWSYLIRGALYKIGLFFAVGAIGMYYSMRYLKWAKSKKHGKT